MTGARQLARDYIAPFMRNAPTPPSVLDVCCGDKWLRQEFPNIACVGLDIKYGEDLTKPFASWPEVVHEDSFDVIVSCFGLQHLLSEEARVWTLLRRIAKPTTKFVVVGRWAEFSCREMGRADPLNAYDAQGLHGLATASGWRIVEFKTFCYQGEIYFPSLPFSEESSPNAFAATLEPI